MPQVSASQHQPFDSRHRLRKLDLAFYPSDRARPPADLRSYVGRIERKHDAKPNANATMVRARAGATFSSRKISKSGRICRVVHSPSSRKLGKVVKRSHMHPNEPTNSKAPGQTIFENFRLCIASASDPCQPIVARPCFDAQHFETEIQSRINIRVNSQSLPLPRDISAKCGGSAAKSDSKSVAYEFRTKSAQSGGLETNGRRERISGLGRCVAVRRFSREARGYWRFQRAQNPAENVGRERTGGEEWDSNTRYGLSHAITDDRFLAPTEQQRYPERTGIHRRLERYCVQFRARCAFRDPAPPARWPRWGFGGAADGAALIPRGSHDQDSIEAFWCGQRRGRQVKASQVGSAPRSQANISADEAAPCRRVHSHCAQQSGAAGDQTGSGDCDAAWTGRCHHGCNDAGDGLAAAFGAGFPRRHRSKEARSQSAVGSRRQRAHLSDQRSHSFDCRKPEDEPAA